MNSKLKNFLMGLGLLISMLTGTVNDVKAQSHNNRKNTKQQTEQVKEFSEPEEDYGISEMTDEEKRVRLDEISKELEKLEKLAKEREENYQIIRDYISKEFPMEKYNNENAFKLPAARYIQDSLMSGNKKALEAEKAPATIEQLQMEREALGTFFGLVANEGFMEMTGISLGFAQDLLNSYVTRLVAKEDLTPEQGKIVAKALSVFAGNTKQISASKYQVIVSEISSRYYRDIGALRMGLQNGEINPTDYTKRQEQISKIYSLLERIIIAVEKKKELSGSSIYSCMRKLTDYAWKSRVAQYRFDDLHDEESKLKKALDVSVPVQDSINTNKNQHVPNRGGARGVVGGR